MILLPNTLLLALLIGGQSVLGDMPSHCLYEDVRGTWTFEETERSGNSSLSCEKIKGPIKHVKNFTLSYPNLVKDEIGDTGTWVMMHNKGIEVNINERSYFAFFFNEKDKDSGGKKLKTYCDKTFNGWSRDATLRNWACFNAKKAIKVAPRMIPIPVMWQHKARSSAPKYYRNDPSLVEEINTNQDWWTAKEYPHFEKYTVEEIQGLMGSSVSHSTRSFNTLPPPSAPLTALQKSRASVLPESFDWRDKDGVNYVTPVRNQHPCSAGYAFASAAMLESRLRVATKNKRKDIFSPQDIVSCSLLSKGCQGGFAYLAAGRYAQEQGVVTEDCNPYAGSDTGKFSKCNTNSSCPRTYVSKYEFVGGYYGACNEVAMMEALVRKGPIIASFLVDNDFLLYKNGTYRHTGIRHKTEPIQEKSHVVLVVGYGVNEDTCEKYWIAKNSWGKDWGEDGYFRIRRGTNECSFESTALQATVIP